MGEKQYTFINEMSQHVGETVQLRGWVFNTRSSGKIRFLIFRDGTGFLQCVAARGDMSEEGFELRLIDRRRQRVAFLVGGYPTGGFFVWSGGGGGEAAHDRGLPYRGCPTRFMTP